MSLIQRIPLTTLQVIRDMFYNGNAQYEPGAVVCRVSKSFVRFGTFQLPVTRWAGWPYTLPAQLC